MTCNSYLLPSKNGGRLTPPLRSNSKHAYEIACDILA